MKKYVVFFALQILVIIAVTLVFKIIEDRKIASIIASLCFIGSSLYYVIIEYKDGVWKYSSVFISSILFLMAVALPMLISRILQWDVEFSQVVVLGIPGPLFHRISNGFYIAMMLTTLWSLFQNRKKYNQVK